MSSKTGKFKSFLSNPWIVSIGSGLIILLLTMIVDLITAKKIFSTIKYMVSVVWNALLAFFNFELKIWWILIALLILVFALVVIKKFLKSKPINPPEPPFISYTCDTILEYKWKWLWEKDFYGKYKIEDLHPVCDQCSTPLTPDHTYCDRLKCLRCKKEYRNIIPEATEVKTLILDNVRRKYFPND